MAEQTKVELTRDKLDMYGVQVTVTVRIGDWTRYISLSPVSYDIYKKWNDIYADTVHGSMVRDIEHRLSTETKGKL